MDVVLGDVDVEVIVAVLVEAGLFASWSDIACHCVRDYCTGAAEVLSDYLGQRWVLAVWDVVEDWDARAAACHSKNTVDFSGKHYALAQLLSAQSGFINFDRAW